MTRVQIQGKLHYEVIMCWNQIGTLLIVPAALPYPGPNLSATPVSATPLVQPHHFSVPLLTIIIPQISSLCPLLELQLRWILPTCLYQIRFKVYWLIGQIIPRLDEKVRRA